MLGSVYFGRFIITVLHLVCNQYVLHKASHSHLAHSVWALSEVGCNFKGLLCINIAGNLACALSTMHAVDAHVDDSCSILNHALSDQIRLASCNYENVCLLSDFTEVISTFGTDSKSCRN